MTHQIVNSDALTHLMMMDDESVHCAITSPAYYGLRKYGTNPVIWDEVIGCQHEWGEVHPPGHRGTDTNPGPLQSTGNKNRQNLTSDTCRKCGAWRGELGLEPTPELYVKHLVTIFHELKRVLRSDGTFWLNIGDSYASGKGSCFNPGGNENSLQDDCKQAGGIPTLRPNISTVKSWGMKPKDLIGIPWMLAFALRADGWYLRSDLPWIKRNSMPSSVTDRPASSIEHVFLFAKSKKYYYDHIATMQPAVTSENRPNGVKRSREFGYEGKLNVHPEAPPQFKKQDEVGNNTYTGFNERYAHTPASPLRFMRDSDFFFRTWQGLLHNEDGEPMALVVNPRGYKGAHFACFPIQLVEPMILASTSEKGVCPECGAPWKRVVNKVFVPQQDVKDPDKLAKGSNKGLDESNRWNETPRGTTAVETVSWQPTCSHNLEPIPATILDPFAGSSATGVACDWHNRTYIGIELNPEYCKLGEQRIKDGK